MNEGARQCIGGRLAGAKKIPPEDCNRCGNNEQAEKLKQNPPANFRRRITILQCAMLRDKLAA